MVPTNIADYVTKSSKVEQEALLAEVVQRLLAGAPAGPLVVRDPSGRQLGVFHATSSEEGDFFQEGSIGFFRELEGRRASPNWVTPEEAIARLGG